VCGSHTRELISLSVSGEYTSKICASSFTRSNLGAPVKGDLKNVPPACRIDSIRVGVGETCVVYERKSERYPTPKVKGKARMGAKRVEYYHLFSERELLCMPRLYTTFDELRLEHIEACGPRGERPDKLEGLRMEPNPWRSQ
jgi:hypothetical protein